MACLSHPKLSELELRQFGELASSAARVLHVRNHHGLSPECVKLGIFQCELDTDGPPGLRKLPAFKVEQVPRSVQSKRLA